MSAAHDLSDDTVRLLTVQEAVSILSAEGIVALPTETVYGLAGLATSQIAVQKIYAAKNRPADNPLICHFSDAEHIKKYVIDPPVYFDILTEAFCPGPISFLLNLKPLSPLKPATCNQDSVVCRIPNSSLFLNIIRSLKIPLAAPSANTSGQISPVNVQMVINDLGNRIDGVLDGGSCSVGLESTILDCREADSITILRPGVIGKFELETALASSRLEVKINDPMNNSSKLPTTPGSKYKHYAPKTPVDIVADTNALTASLKLDANDGHQKITILHTIQDLTQLHDLLGDDTRLNLICLGDLDNFEELASKIFYSLYRMDRLNASKAYWLKFDIPETSAGQAFINRMRRAIQLK